MRRALLLIPPIILLAAISHISLRVNSHDDDEVLAQQITPPPSVPLQHDARQEKFWNTHTLKVAQQGTKVKLVSDGELPGFTTGCGSSPCGTTKLLREGQQFVVLDRHGRIVYTVREIQQDGVILDCYSSINLSSFGENRVATSKSWIKLNWH